MRRAFSSLAIALGERDRAMPARGVRFLEHEILSAVVSAAALAAAARELAAIDNAEVNTPGDPSSPPTATPAVSTAPSRS
jgi:hypothetical protein